MSISLKVVNEAAVFCASFNLSAILNLILFILILSSVLAKLPNGLMFAGALPEVDLVDSLDAGVAASFFGAGASFFGAGVSFFGAGAASSFFGAGAASSFFGAGSSFLAAGAAPPAGAAPGSILAISWPTVTVSSGATSNSVTVPETGALTSTSILSVSMVANNSSSLMNSPTFLEKEDKVPSVMDSAISGTLTT